MVLNRRAGRFAREYLGASFSLAASGQFVDSLNSPYLGGASRGLQTFGHFLPTYSSIYGSGLVLGELRRLQPRKMRRR